jgi:hypothetical protein
MNSQSNYNGDPLSKFLRFYNVDLFNFLVSLVYGWMNIGKFDG